MLIDFKQLFRKHHINCTGLLHCGASTGQEAQCYHELGIPEVMWVEAVPSVYDQLLINLLQYPNQWAVNICISNEDNKEVVFNVSNNEAQSSSFLELGHHKIIHPEVHYVRTINMLTTRIDTLFNRIERDFSHFNFLNLDLQGTELLALQGMGDILKQFDYIYSEVNMLETYIGCSLIEEIDKFLSDFDRVETGEWVASSWTDALYIRKK